MKKKLLFIAIGIVSLNVNAQTQFIGASLTNGNIPGIPSSGVTAGTQYSVSSLNGAVNFSGFSNFTGSFNLALSATSASSTTQSDFVLGYYNTNGMSIWKSVSPLANNVDNPGWLDAVTSNNQQETMNFTFSSVSATPNTVGYTPDLKIVSFTVSQMGNSGERVEFLSGGSVVQTYNSDGLTPSGGTDANSQRTITLTTPIALSNGLTVGIRANTDGVTNSQFRITGFTIKDLNETLPVTISSFTVKSTADNMAVNWTTSSEQNNSHFNVLRAGNDKNFSVIGRVTGDGNSNDVKTYTFIDKVPLAGANYYILEQVDFNGQSKTFGPVAANFSLNNKDDFSVSKIAGTSKLSINLSLDAKSNAFLTIYDLAGQKMFSKSIVFEASNNTLEINNTNLNQGLYIMVVETKNKSYRSKFIY